MSDDDLPPGFTLKPSSDDPPPGFTVKEPSTYEKVTDFLHGISGATSASTQGVVRGMPILGPAVEKGTSAAISAMPGAPSYGAIQGDKQRLAAEHPYASTAGEVAGSVMATVPAARAFPAAFGGPSWLGQTLAGGGIGGTDAAVRSGGDWGEIKKGTAIGALGPTIGSALAPIGSAIGSGARWVADKTPGLRSVFQKIEPAASDAIRDAAESGYRSMGKFPFDRDAMNDVRYLIGRDLYHDFGRSHAVGASQTHSILNRMDTLPPTAASMHTLRKELGDVAYSPTANSNERASARYARDKIDQFLENPPPNAFTGTPGQRTKAGETLRDSNANWRSASSSDTLRDRVTNRLQRTELTNPLAIFTHGRDVRSGVGSFLSNPRASRFLQPNEREALREVGGRTIGDKALQTVGAVTGTNRAPSMITALPGAASVFGAIDPMTAAVLTGGGMAANLASGAASKKALAHADKVIRSNAPFSQQEMAKQIPTQHNFPPGYWTDNAKKYLPAQWPASISPKGSRDEISRLLALQAEREATQPKRERIEVRPNSRR